LRAKRQRCDDTNCYLFHSSLSLTPEIFILSSSRPVYASDHSRDSESLLCSYRSGGVPNAFKITAVIAQGV
jgi:hypothetical protein